MMDELISRRDAINAVSEITTTMSVCTNKDECYGMKRMQKQAITELANLPSAEPKHPDINAGNMDVISRQQAIDTLRKMQTYKLFAGDDMLLINQAEAQTELMMLPSAQPDIIRCKDCKYWNPQLKTANGNGLGSCDFHNVALVTSEGFCYWAERGEQNDSEAD